MDASKDIDALMEALNTSAIRTALEAAYTMGRHQGFAEGQASMRDSILRAVGGTTVDVGLNAQASATEVTSGGDGEPARRAPKGLTRTIIDEVLRDKPGLTVKEIGELAAVVDERVSVKTIYNVLKLNDKLYVARNDRWFLRDSGNPIIGVANPPPELEDDLVG